MSGTDAQTATPMTACCCSLIAGGPCIHGMHVFDKYQDMQRLFSLTYPGLKIRCSSSRQYLPACSTTRGSNKGRSAQLRFRYQSLASLETCNSGAARTLSIAKQCIRQQTQGPQHIPCPASKLQLCYVACEGRLHLRQLILIHAGLNPELLFTSAARTVASWCWQTGDNTDAMGSSLSLAIVCSIVGARTPDCQRRVSSV